MSRPPVETTIHLAIAELGSAAADRVLRDWSMAEDQVWTQRADRLLGRALLRGVLAQLSPGRWHVAKMEGGKPLAVSADGTRPPSVSISHSGRWSACAVSFDGEVGIDIETMRCDRNWMGVASRAFGPLECAEVTAEGCARFYAIWALREAVAKAVGTGLAMVADGKDRAHGFGLETFRATSIDGEPWQMIQRTLDPDLSLALALRAAARPRLRLQWWFGDPLFL